MSKLYVFAIGGTGSRVLRSFCMMMASGVHVNCESIVAIIIDPDHANADLTRTIMLLEDYAKIRAELSFPQGANNKFFRTEISKPFSNRYTLFLKDTEDRPFKNFIGLSEMEDDDQAMMQMLFSEHNLNAQMDVGFKGNPNIGSVVLNQIVDSDEFVEFANSFAAGDKIFIISSIFGGTGASGFPLLLKTLRTDENIPNHALINNAEIGAVTVLPYFMVNQDEESEVDSATFISKTKSALAYYEKNVCANGQVNAMYYLADNIAGKYENHEGGAAQQNNAHLIELMSATAIVDFCNNSFEQHATIHKELGINDLGTSEVSFVSFGDDLKSMFRLPLTQFTLMANCFAEKFDNVQSLNFAHEFPDGFFRGEFMNRLKQITEKYRQWLDEMKDNNRSLNLFNTQCGEKPFEVVVGVKPNKVFSFNTDYNLFFDRLNKYKGERRESHANKLLEIFYLATKQLCNEKFKF